MRRYATACKAEQVPLLARSMLDHCESFTLHVLAWDWEPGPPWTAWGEQRCDFVYTTRDELLTRHPELASLPGPPRTVNETVCAVRWQFLCDVMLETGLPVTLIDGDQWFWSNPEPLFEEIGDAPAAFSPHVFAPAAAGMRGVTLESHARYGRFNGGWSYWSNIAMAQRMAELARIHSRAADYTLPGGRKIWGDQSWLEVVKEEFDAKQESWRVLRLRDDQGIPVLAGDQSQVRKPQPSQLPQVRREGDDRLRSVEDVLRELPSGLGARAEPEAFPRPGRLQGKLRAGQLPVGGQQAAAPERVERRDGDLRGPGDVPQGRLREGRDEIQGRVATNEPLELDVRQGDIRARGDALGTRGSYGSLIHVIQHPGVNVGPWNIHTLSLRQACDGRLFFGNERLISYHYSSFRLGEQDAFPEYDLTDRQRELLYRPYETAVRRINR